MRFFGPQAFNLLPPPGALYVKSATKRGTNNPYKGGPGFRLIPMGEPNLNSPAGFFPIVVTLNGVGSKGGSSTQYVVTGNGWNPVQCESILIDQNFAQPAYPMIPSSYATPLVGIPYGFRLDGTGTQWWCGTNQLSFPSYGYMLIVADSVEEIGQVDDLSGSSYMEDTTPMNSGGQLNASSPASNYLYDWAQFRQEGVNYLTPNTRRANLTIYNADTQPLIVGTFGQLTNGAIIPPNGGIGSFDLPRFLIPYVQLSRNGGSGNINGTFQVSDLP
jgi:hypothetical protein